ncbi:clarin-3 [Osmerus mordax]|uniref:clarin-3 n=1 Tax=Osmerus mordax TaxID=8014 RepID=UPI00350EC843
MPSSKKTLYFLLSANALVIAVGILAFGMSTEWASSTMQCSKKGDGFFNGTAELKLGLFNGKFIRITCPIFGGEDTVKVLTMLGQVGGAPVVLQALVICLLALCLLGSASSILITLYNSVSNPYETYMGPLGLYACSSASAGMSFLAIILYVVNVAATRMSEDLVENFLGPNSVDLENKRAEMGVGFFMLIPYLVLNLLAILLVYLYEHAAYTQRQEQQRPTEDAPKEIMMY